MDGSNFIAGSSYWEKSNKSSNLRPNIDPQFVCSFFASKLSLCVDSFCSNWHSEWCQNSFFELNVYFGPPDLYFYWILSIITFLGLFSKNVVFKIHTEPQIFLIFVNWKHMKRPIWSGLTTKCKGVPFNPFSFPLKAEVLRRFKYSMPCSIFSTF